MIFIFGERTYGKVDRVPGVCHVVTKFAHLNFLPLWPKASYIVLDGSESGGEFNGKQIPLSLKSVLAGYVRAWLTVPLLLLCFFSYFGLGMMADQLKIGEVFVGVAWVTGLAALLTLWVRGKVGAILQVAVYASSALLWYVFSHAEWAVPPAKRQGNLANGLTVLVATNVCLLAYGVTRFFDRASTTRAQQLLHELGIDNPPKDDDDQAIQPAMWEDWDVNEDGRKRDG